MATEQDLHDWTAASGRDWDQMCQAYCWNLTAVFGTPASAQASAIIAYYNSHIESYDAWSAPVGSFIWLDIGTYGHVVFVVDSGDAMGSKRVTVVWGINAGVMSLADYVAQTGADPLGWSWDNAGGTLPFTPAGAPSPITESEDEMKPMIIWGDQTGPNHSYFWDPVTGLRRSLTTDEVGLINFAAGQPGGQPVVNMQVSQQTLDALPKAPGSK